MRNEPKKPSIFSGQEIRRFWNEGEEKWYFSIVDVISVLSESTIPKRYCQI